ncbi:MAG: aminodeoxychorismate/anthranilate synthase component II [Leptospiraceae bacterium]|nr:aminodeoxychorismate/anthranilate synthase component II [Leptospiraceae bacterium]
MKVLIVDNYDSFTFNLYQIIGEILADSGRPFSLDVIRNDERDRRSIESSQYTHIILSPGPGDPGLPEYFGVCAELLLETGKKTPIFGVCLGMQGIAHCYGGRIVPAAVPMHGKTSPIQHDGQGVFRDLPQDLEVMRYHSLIADPTSLPDVLEITARCAVDGASAADSNFEIMGLRHKEYPIEGIQFHPESFASEGGVRMLANFLQVQSV